VALVELLEPPDHAAVSRVLVDAYGDYAERLGPVDWASMREELANAAGQLPQARIGGVREAGGLDAVVFYFPPGRSLPMFFPPQWASLRLVGVIHRARERGLTRQLLGWCIDQARQAGSPQIGLHTSEIMDTARALYERMGFVVDCDLPPMHGLRYWRYRLDLSEA
jgi:GNAT superfamily N-acetyltransferase